MQLRFLWSCHSCVFSNDCCDVCSTVNNSTRHTSSQSCCIVYWNIHSSVKSQVFIQNCDSVMLQVATFLGPPDTDCCWLLSDVIIILYCSTVTVLFWNVAATDYQCAMEWMTFHWMNMANAINVHDCMSVRTRPANRALKGQDEFLLIGQWWTCLSIGPLGLWATV